MHTGIRSALISHFIHFFVCLVFILFACFAQTFEQKTGRIILGYLRCGSMEVFIAFLFTGQQMIFKHLSGLLSQHSSYLVSFSTLALQDWDSTMLSVSWVQGGCSWSITPKTPGRQRGGRKTLIRVLVCKC